MTDSTPEKLSKGPTPPKEPDFNALVREFEQLIDDVEMTDEEFAEAERACDEIFRNIKSRK